MYPEIERLVVDTKELTWSTVDVTNPEEMTRLRDEELERATQRVHDAVHRLRERGIIDDQGHPISKEVPADMRDDANTDFGG
jgi:hypothetical protein